VSDQFQVTSGEYKLVRLFAVDLPADDIDGLREADLAAALGVERLDVDQIDFFSVDDLEGLGLVDYMIEGLGIAEDQLADDRARLMSLTGQLLIVRSAAFMGLHGLLSVKAPLRWIGTYAEDRSKVTFEALPTGGTEGNVPSTNKKRPSDAAMSGRVAMVVLLVLFMLTGAMVWIAS